MFQTFNDFQKFGKITRKQRDWLCEEVGHRLLLFFFAENDFLFYFEDSLKV